MRGSSTCRRPTTRARCARDTRGAGRAGPFRREPIDEFSTIRRIASCCWCWTTASRSSRRRGHRGEGRIAQCNGVRVLATSREPLDISGERIYRLSSLDLSIGRTELFADRARAAHPKFRRPQRRGTIRTICTRLDGMALAIELAAARVRTMPLRRSRRGDCNSGCSRAAGTGARSQQTMRATIDWSYDLLSAEEQRSCAAAQLFAGDFSLEVPRATYARR